ncbi:MAG: type I methionyl aminopeptidase [Saprospiraceae bacterium]|nr:type I methionyl aminopeptidase [Saprospiraceae bacterium]MBK8449335.1 type I methionyl aminopeptidase [Saprospiraceae bacterium]MBK8484593.1 type I methionyl aminopeptidase [Saprospiraceae bacterium]MBK9222020.1 type I methionyl aminopeptidase [Saprospiraceae bacterium]MBK9721070.1 type I methionyl aminopeptidase [Saprospiraceae bacterium]
MIYLKTEEEIECIRQSCLLVCKTIAEIATMLRPGITGLELDKRAEEFIKDHHAVPAFKGYNGFPGTLCISRNEEVVHGIPNHDSLKAGDIVSIDCGVSANGFFGDAAYTFALGDISEAVKMLMKATLDSLNAGIKEAKVGNRIGDISQAVQDSTEGKFGFGVVRELVGHGIGRQLHEPPEVPNFGKRGRGLVLKEGLVIAIEPMINLGTKRVKQLKDGWTVITQDKKPSAHFEHTIVVRKEEGERLSDHSFIENSVKNNIELTKIS